MAALSLVYLVAVGVASIVASPMALGQNSSSQKAAAPKPAPDVIVFTNGDQLTGTLEKGEGDSITFKSDMAGEITVPLAKIKELRTNGNFALLRKDTKTPKNAPIGTVSYEDGDLIVAAPAGSERVPAKNVDFLVDQTTYESEVHPPKRGIKGLAHGWTGDLTGGATIVELDAEWPRRTRRRWR